MFQCCTFDKTYCVFKLQHHTLGVRPYNNLWSLFRVIKSLPSCFLFGLKSVHVTVSLCPLKCLSRTGSSCKDNVNILDVAMLVLWADLWADSIQISLWPVSITCITTTSRHFHRWQATDRHLCLFVRQIRSTNNTRLLIGQAPGRVWCPPY